MSEKVLLNREIYLSSTQRENLRKKGFQIEKVKSGKLFLFKRSKRRYIVREIARVEQNLEQLYDVYGLNGRSREDENKEILDIYEQYGF